MYPQPANTYPQLANMYPQVGYGVYIRMYNKFTSQCKTSLHWDVG